MSLREEAKGSRRAMLCATASMADAHRWIPSSSARPWERTTSGGFGGCERRPEGAYGRVAICMDPSVEMETTVSPARSMARNFLPCVSCAHVSFPFARSTKYRGWNPTWRFSGVAWMGILLSQPSMTLWSGMVGEVAESDAERPAGLPTPEDAAVLWSRAGLPESASADEATCCRRRRWRSANAARTCSSGEAEAAKDAFSSAARCLGRPISSAGGVGTSASSCSIVV